jgi:hypothetical protein
MARGAKIKAPGRPQTLREARRAYQKAGRTPSLTAAQIRAAQRAVEQDKRAKDILAKEKRAQEAKRKREEQEAKRREEQKKLVELGKLPEESLWGKVRPSQPRLHNFFSIPPQQTKIEGNIHKTAFPSQDLSGEAGGRSVGSVDEESLDPGWTLASTTPTTLESQNTTPLPAPQKPTNTAKYDDNSAKPVLRQGPRDTLATQGTLVQQLDVQLSFSPSQFISDFADDKDLEAELNGLASSEDKLDHLSASKMIDYRGPKVGPHSRKRKASDATHVPPLSTKTTKVRVMFAQMSSSMLNSRQLDRAGISCAISSTTRLSDTNAVNNHSLIREDSDFCHDSEEDFSCDLDAEMLNLPSQPFSTGFLGGLQSRPQRQSARQTTPPRSQVQEHANNGTQETIYDFDSLDGEELSGLADMFSSS